MTLEQYVAHDLFGLIDSFPLPGWTVLDAARAHRFTGELTFDVEPAVRVYFDDGRVYLAERAADPQLGDRLVDAGALTPVQLEQGVMRIGELEHLGRLFDRVPSADRDTVMLTIELMNDACVAWIAGQQIPRVLGTPYLHHPTGVHRWDRPADAVDLAPGDPLPAPAPTDVPVAPPVEPETDPLVRWDPSTWLDERTAAPRSMAPEPSGTGTPCTATPPAVPPDPTPEPASAPWTTVTPTAAPAPPATAPPTLPATPAPHEPAGPALAPEPVEPATTASAPPAPPAPPVPAPTPEPERTGIAAAGDPLDSFLHTDWIDRLERDGLPTVADPLASPAQLPPVAVDRRDHFELIWPSGEIDEDFGAVAAVEGDDERDRVGPTARVVRSVDVADDPLPVEESSDLWDFETTGPIFEAVAPPPAVVPDTTTDETVLSMRRAVGTIETESHRRPEPQVAAEPSPDVPGRIATRTESSVWAMPGHGSSTCGSVFDEVRVCSQPTTETAIPADASHRDAAGGDEPERVSALRRLIGGLRRS